MSLRQPSSTCIRESLPFAAGNRAAPHQTCPRSGVVCAHSLPPMGPRPWRRHPIIAVVLRPADGGRALRRPGDGAGQTRSTRRRTIAFASSDALHNKSVLCTRTRPDSPQTATRRANRASSASQCDMECEPLAIRVSSSSKTSNVSTMRLAERTPGFAPAITDAAMPGNRAPPRGAERCAARKPPTRGYASNGPCPPAPTSPKQDRPDG